MGFLERKLALISFILRAWSDGGGVLLVVKNPFCEPFFNLLGVFKKTNLKNLIEKFLDTPLSIGKLNKSFHPEVDPPNTLLSYASAPCISIIPNAAKNIAQNLNSI